MTVLLTERSVLANRNEFRLVHAVTGAPITGYTATLVDPVRRPGWSVRKFGNVVLVNVVDRYDDPAINPQIRITVTDPISKARLEPFGAPPGAARPELSHEKVVTLNAGVTIDGLVPSPASLTISLRRRTGPALDGQVVELHGAGGATLVLAEGPPGDYGVVDHVWTAPFAVCDIEVGSEVHDRQFVLDPWARHMRLRLIHP